MDKPITQEWNWQSYFNWAILEGGRNELARLSSDTFECDPNGAWASMTTAKGFHVQVLRAPVNYQELRRYPPWNRLDYRPHSNSPLAFSRFYSCTCSQGVAGQRCRHLAALMFKWEQVHGPFVMTETDEDFAARLESERKRAAEALRKKQLVKEKKDKQARKFPAIDYVLARAPEAPKALCFPPDDILRGSRIMTNQYEAELADALPISNENAGLTMQAVCSPGDKQVLDISGHIGENTIHIILRQDRFSQLTCSCNRSYIYGSYWNGIDRSNAQMCCHALVLWMRARELIIRDNPGDVTDYNGFQLLSLMADDAQSKSAPIAEAKPRKRPCVALEPRITRDRMSDTVKLNFDIGRVGERAYAVKSLESLVTAVEEEKDYAISKAAGLRFSEETFTDSALEWYQLIQSRVRAVRRVNARLNRSFYSSSSLSVGTGIPLEESDLDIVYDMAEGSEINYQFGTRTETCRVRVCEALPSARMQLDPITAEGRLVGLSITGAAPRLLRGNLYQYILDTTCFGRVTGGETAFLDAMQEIADGTGAFQCTIGERKLAEFYYRVLPVMQRNPQFSIVDKVGDLIEGLLPAEPQFAFYLDIAGNRITCDTRVSYDGFSFRLGKAPDALAPRRRDIDQEQRVSLAVQRIFPIIDKAAELFCAPNEDDTLLWILTDGIAVLSQYGEVNGSDAFKRVHVRPAPQPRFTVRIEGGLLDLSVQTKDLTEDELLALLGSYRLKKNWHRLSSGDFIDLRNPEALDALEETAQAMDLSLEALVQGGAALPSYRALYVDRLLEEHNAVAASRDRLFKSLIRSFQTIKDSDFDAPEGLSDVLRPYQLYGFRWLCTLAQAGFGGILADEMGLGKTVQMLSFIQAQKDAGERRPALVVCPASLVYNWQDECRKFTPRLRIEALAGALRQRKAQLSDLSADLYITSYDLLRRDIALYDAVAFSTVVLDEAQYVKNQRAAVSKVVRVLKAEHRFALTGTPIENRLSELWSIFDFLMPGFLYSAQVFGARFEGPVMKQKDAQATAKLSRMTGPFILRRRKADVLKDLPEKLEETRSSQMEEDQRRLYDAQLVRMKALLESSGNTGEDKLRILAEITRLRQLCCDPSLLFDDYSGSSAKRAACLELIQNAMDAGHRMLVFSQFTSMLALLETDLKAAGIPFYTLTGATPKLERLRLVNAFNEGDVPVFLISLKAGGTGLNLTGADVVIHYDPWWNLAVQNQATDRAHRIGQTRQVTVIKLIAADTIEERIIRLQETKRELAEAIISGESTSLMSLSREELMELLS